MIRAYPFYLLYAFMFSTAIGKLTSLLQDDFAIAVCKDKILFPLKDFNECKDIPAFDIGVYNGKRLVCLNLPGMEGGVSLRTLFAEAEPELARVAAFAAHFVWWRTLYRHCPRCGEFLKEHEFERCLRCEPCGEDFYPVIFPAIIVLIVKDGKILLAHNTRFPPKRYSLLAGYVEMGESLEAAVHREVMEEAGIRVKNLRYIESQPWPLSNSLMAAFEAEWESGELRPDGVEIEQAAWFAPDDELPDLPPHGSVARKIIEGWLGKRA